jgi:hypothetical protein
MKDWLQITNLLYSYNEYIDRGNLDAATELFKYAKLKIPGREEPVDHEMFLEMLKRVIIIYPDGTPGTRHLVTNPIINIDEEKGTATSQATFTVLQQTATLPLQIIATGYYNDQFEKHGGEWRFKYRESTLPHIYGSIECHINFRAL